MDLVPAERRENVAILTFNRPEKLNALSTLLLGEFHVRLRELESDGEIRCLVLTGAGERSFVAGADIEEYSRQDPGQFREYQRFSRELFTYLDRFPKPVIAAVNGYALGGGFEIALCCDFMTAATNASFGLPEGRLGLCPGGGGTQRLTRAVGPFVASDLLLSGRRLSAREALALGLVSQVVPQESLIPAAVEKANQVSASAPLALREMKGLIAGALDSPLEAGLSAEQDALFRLRGTRDAAEGIRAFVEKREPRFQGV